MAELNTGYPINYTSSGDKTQEALMKGANLEMVKIYSHLNAIRNTQGLGKVIAISSSVANKADLSIEDQPGTIRIVTSEKKMYYFDGLAWEYLPFNETPRATKAIYGRVSFGNYEGFTSEVPRPDKAATVAMLEEFKQDPLVGMPVGAVVMWAKPELPAGWVLCDGRNGTPNLVNRFIRVANGDAGATGGADRVNTPTAGVLEHKHTFELKGSIAAHTHTFSGDTSSTATDHSHTAGIAGSTTTDGSHTHSYSTEVSTVQIYSGLPADVYNTSESAYRTTMDYAGEHNHLMIASADINGNTANHSHTVEATLSEVAGKDVEASGETTGPQNPGQASSIELSPRHYKLFFIMKQEVA